MTTITVVGELHPLAQTTLDTLRNASCIAPDGTVRPVSFPAETIARWAQQPADETETALAALTRAKHVEHTLRATPGQPAYPTTGEALFAISDKGAAHATPLNEERF